MSANIESRLEKFMEHADYERATEALYEVARSAYLAGWLAARAAPPASCRGLPKDGGTNNWKR